MPTPPFVFIVGAGPGDPSLLTIRARDCLAVSDVVIYDHPVSAAVLGRVAGGAECIDVGAAAPRSLDQDAISYLLADKAREGKIVARLKWGDPFLFDSGGREALFLHQQGIPFEVVPGLPLAIAGPAYAGIPLTFPGARDPVVLIRGDEAEGDEPPDVDWHHAAGSRGTLVCHAGARQIGPIIRALLSHGRSAHEPAVLIYDGTTPRQHTVDGTLADLPGRALSGRPALLVVGAVAALRGHLRWFDSRPLFGKRIVVTRAREQAGELAQALEELGAEVIALPAIRVVPPEDSTALDEACATAESFDWLVFTSANGVNHFMRRFLSRRDIRDLKGPRICTVGPSTAVALAAYGLHVDLTPAEYRSEGIINALGKNGSLAGLRFLLPRSEIARELLVQELRGAGAEVADVAAYTTLGAAEGGEDVYRMLLDRRVDAVTFTSASTVRSFVQSIGTEQAADLLKETTIAAIGPVTAEAASQCGLTASIVPDQYTIAALVDALVAHFTSPPVSQTASS